MRICIPVNNYTSDEDLKIELMDSNDISKNDFKNEAYYLYKFLEEECDKTFLLELEKLFNQLKVP